MGTHVACAVQILKVRGLNVLVNLEAAKHRSD